MMLALAAKTQARTAAKIHETNKKATREVDLRSGSTMEA
jgi:hypothetical protein